MEIYGQVCRAELEMIRVVLEALDDEILKDREPGMYENLGFKPTHIETVNG